MILLDATPIITYTDHFFIGLFNFFEWAFPFLAVSLSLTIADLRFGISASKRRGEEVRRSRAIRRTLTKQSDYIIWIILAYTIGQAFTKPFGLELAPMIILFFVCISELESVIINYFESRGKNVKIKLFKGFRENYKHIIKIDKKDDDDNNKEL